MGVTTVDKEPDGDLVRLHREGDAEAFAVLYERFFGRLVRLCYGRVGDRALAEDLAQETLVRAYTKLERFDAARPMWPWLRTIALRLCIDVGRRSQPREHPPAPVVLDDGMDQTLGSLVERPRLAAALAALTQRQRTALALRYVYDWDAERAARYIGLSRTAFDQLLFRARRRMQTEYERLGAAAGVLAALRARAIRRVTTWRHRAGGLPASSSAAFVELVANAVAACLVAVAAVTAVGEHGGAGAPGQRAPLATAAPAASAPAPPAPGVPPSAGLAETATPPAVTARRPPVDLDLGAGETGSISAEITHSTPAEDDELRVHSYIETEIFDEPGWMEDYVYLNCNGVGRRTVCDVADAVLTATGQQAEGG